MSSSKAWTLACGCAFVIAAASSCRDVVGSNDVDAIQALCSTVGQCYEGAPSCDDLAGRANDATDDQRRSFLSGLTPATCFDTCAGSRACLDTEMLCLALGADCDPGFDTCCQFTSGTRECSPAGRCCATKGAPCGGDDDCCDLACEGGYCGGQACTVVDAPCRYGFECCTGRCPNGSCEKLECSLLGDPCFDVAECCPVGDLPVGFHLECAGGGQVGTCQAVPDEASCLPVGAPCASSSASDASKCCEGLSCEVAVVTQESHCVPPECRTEGFDCAADADCCGTLICNLALDVSFCTEPMGCAKADTPCQSGPECCSGVCFGGACLQGSGTPCESTGTCHSPTETGPALPADCATGSCPACIATVRAADVFCACTAWDQLCVEAYESCAATECP